MWFQSAYISNFEDKEVADVIQRVKSGTCENLNVNLANRFKNEEELHLLLDALIERPSVIDSIVLPMHVSDDIGVKVAQLVAASANITYISAVMSDFTKRTYVALAHALRTNSSLQFIYIDGLNVSTRDIDSFFIDAMRLNPLRPVESRWKFIHFYSPDCDFKRLCPVVKILGRPSLMEILLME